MYKYFKDISQNLSKLAFPNVCVCCGRENTHRQRQICSFCLEDRFEDANPDNKPASSDTLMPEGLLYQHALWKFDKGGDLQHLLHQLKYNRLTAIGVDLGRKLGERVKCHPQINSTLQQNEAVLLPVPLHYLKFRYRGFNQAFEIARGFEVVFSDLDICGIKDVVRTKNTNTQTGFSLEKRLQNIDKAFSVNNPSVFTDNLVIIIDDVFTTGATTFELAQTLLQSGSGEIIILTIAQA